MSILSILIPVTLCMGIVGLFAFFWSMKNGQYEDLSGDAERILFQEDIPLQSAAQTNVKEYIKETSR